MRSAEAAAALADAGVARVVIGTAALEDPDLVATDRGRASRVALGPRRPGPRGRGAGLGRGLGRRRGRRRSRGSPTPAPRRVVVTQIAVDGTAGRPRPRRAGRGARRHRRSTSSPPAASARSTTCAPWPASTAGGRRLAGAIVGTALYEGRVDVAEAVAALGMRTARVIPCLDVDAGRVVKGVNFVDLRDAGDPVELAARYDAEGADELVFLDITASSDARDTIVDVAARDGRAGVHPVHHRRRHPLGRRRPPAAAGGRRQGVGQHRGRRAARADRRDRRRSSAPSAASSPSTPAAPTLRLRGVHPRRPHADRASTPSTGPSGPRSSAPARSCSRRWTATAPSTASTSSSPRAVTDAARDPGDRQRRRRHARPPRRGRARGRRRRRAGGVDLPLRRAHRSPRPRTSLHDAGIAVRPI